MQPGPSPTGVVVGAGIDAGHGRYWTDVNVAQPERQVHGPVTVVVGTGGSLTPTQLQGRVTDSIMAQAGSAQKDWPGRVGVQPSGVTVEVMVGQAGPPSPPQVAAAGMTDHWVPPQPPGLQGSGPAQSWCTVVVAGGSGQPQGRLMVERARHWGTMHVEQRECEVMVGQAAGYPASLAAARMPELVRW